MIWSLEKLWSSKRPIPEVTPLSPPVGYGTWRVEFGATGEESDVVAYARRSVLAEAKTVTLWLTVTTPTGATRWRSVSGVAPFSAHDTAIRLVAKANAMPEFFAGKARGMTPAEFFAYFKKHAALSVADVAPKEPQKPDTGAHLGRLLRELKNDLFTRKQWRLQIGDNLDRAPEPERLTPIVPPKDRIWADPFLVEESGKTFVFFEEMLFSEKLGRISVGEWTGKEMKNVRPVLTTDHHLSYPQVFTHAGSRWLTAEAAASGKFTAYRCVQWPDKWEPGPVVFDKPILDPSVFFHGGRWWLFGNLAAAPGAKADDDLHLFFSDDPFAGNWTPHPLNPVVSDARHARGAGRPYVHNGKFYRPAQDCAGGYGRKVVLREITALTTEDFSEKTVETLAPEELGPHAVALHTLNPGRRFVAADFAVRL
jgi:hypothetical protein